MYEIFASDGVTLLVLAIALAIVTLGAMYFLTRKPKAVKLRPVDPRKIMQEMSADRGNSDKEPAPLVKVSWVDGPNGRSRRRYGFLMKQRGLRSWVLPEGASNKRQVVRRKSANVIALSSHCQTAKN